jgi:hypothetical protein
MVGKRIGERTEFVLTERCASMRVVETPSAPAFSPSATIARIAEI